MPTDSPTPEERKEQRIAVDRAVRESAGVPLASIGRNLADFDARIRSRDTIVVPASSADPYVPPRQAIPTSLAARQFAPVQPTGSAQPGQDSGEKIDNLVIVVVNPDTETVEMYEGCTIHGTLGTLVT